MYKQMLDIDLAAMFYRQPDNAIIGELYTRYKREVFKYGVYCNFKYCQNALSREVIEDFTTDVFARLFQQLAQYQISTNFKGWLMRSAHNLFMDLLKKEMLYVDLNRDNEAEIEKKIEITVENEDFGSLLDKASVLAIDTGLGVEEIIALLNKREIDIMSFLARCMEYIDNKEQKICLYHFYIEQKTYKEISQITDYDLKKVKSALQHGKRALQHTIIRVIQSNEKLK
jgi:RNA polymerase sigma factor (sigma-70 family)